MRRLRFNQIFGGLLMLCVISAFFVPGASRQPWANAQILFAPVARPARKITAWFLGTIHPGSREDPRMEANIRQENEQLKTEIALLQGQLQAISKLAAERRQLGVLLNYCVSVPVIGSDGDDRQALNILQSDPRLVPGQAVVCSVGLVGRIQSAGAGGAKVLLITDKASRPVSVSFGRMVRQANGSYLFNRLPTDKTLVYGHGQNQLLAPQGLSLAEVKSADLRPGDWAVLDDSDFPLPLAGLCVGQVTAVGASMTSPLYADIFLRPAGNLQQLQEVLVMREEGR